MIKGLIRREIEARKDLVGTVLKKRELVQFDGTGATGVWVVDVDVGGNRVLRDVPVKAGSDGSRFYADINQTVLLRRNTQGRFDVIGPADRVAAQAVEKEYDLQAGTEVSSRSVGFTVNKVPFEFYQGGGVGASRWNDGVTPFPKVQILDGDGNEV